MDSHPDVAYEACSKLCCSDFVRLPDLHTESSWGFELTNPILKLFSKDKFWVRDEHGVYQLITEADYDKLKPTLRLASRMLRDDRAVHYILTMHDGTVHSGLHGDSPPLSWTDIDAIEPAYHGTKNPHAPKEHLMRKAPRILPAQESREQARCILDSLAGVLKGIGIQKQDSSGKATCLRYLPDVSFTHLDQAARRAFPRAMASRVQLSASLAQLDEAEPSPMSRYKLARVIVHEVAHVLNSAANGHRRHEVFYGNSCTNESGFEFENALFGGTYEQLSLQNCTEFFTESVVVMEHWPSAHTFQAYKGKSYEYTRRCEIGVFDRISRIPYEWVAKTCQDSFWDAREHLSGLSKRLNTTLIGPLNAGGWVMEVLPDDNPIDKLRAIELCDPSYGELLPDYVCGRFAQIFRDKQSRLAKSLAHMPPAE